ncbi:thiocyanate hydrolase subunit gamma [Gordonia namibiensis NBRC 108229]|uniref:Thiocyanate hydrolase subunit gamma n=1 Tax=Gordonia namibiensis NBRC 108229 TaxID=1208314 RepID=K6X8G4_9ACTN|nr:thiocyanate hydrolase subunit gamma [Gordonia namibiensis]GAC02347.1 thiocyanate hydrolase subunit gamma [Gordonia namibiensis NBRC 108229]
MSDATGTHGHDHDHDHARTVAPMVEEVTDFEVLEIALRELCIEKGLFTAEEHRRFTEFAEQIGPTPAATLVARAWLEPDFKELALAEPMTASKEVGVDWLEPTGFGTPSDFTAFSILEDTPSVHHVIVCALCSCYPRPILGNSPEWYRTPNYRRRMVRWPRQVLSEFGLQLPDGVSVRVQDSNQKHRFMVMPQRPAGTEDWTQEQLAEILTRDCLIGVALPRPGVTTNAVTTTVRPAVHPAGD